MNIAAPIAAFVASAALLYFLLRTTLAVRVRDIPNERSLHHSPVPRLGGVGVLSGVAAGWLIVHPPIGAVTVVCLVVLAIASFVDDVRGLPVVVRLLIQLAVAIGFVLSLDKPILAIVPMVFTVVWLLNLYNFMDGADGLAGGMAVVGFTIFGIAASGDDTALAVGAFSVAAAAAGFLVYNFHPARTFLGDAGSISLGFLVAAIGLIGWSRSVWALWFPVVVFSPFIVDSTVTMARRLVRKEKIWLAHKSHYYQRLVQLGWGHRRTVIAEYLVMVAVGSLAVALRNRSGSLQIVGLCSLTVLFAVTAALVDRKWHAFERSAVA